MSTLTLPLIPVSVGELFDKVSILHIKKERITDPVLLAHVNRELDTIEKAFDASLPEPSPEIRVLVEPTIEVLKDTNEALWDLENEIRLLMKRETYDQRFIEVAQGIHRLNDVRSNLKKRINELLQSDIVEVKSYS